MSVGRATPKGLSQVTDDYDDDENEKQKTSILCVGDVGVRICMRPSLLFQLLFVADINNLHNIHFLPEVKAAVALVYCRCS